MPKAFLLLDVIFSNDKANHIDGYGKRALSYALTIAAMKGHPILKVTNLEKAERFGAKNKCASTDKQALIRGCT